MNFLGNTIYKSGLLTNIHFFQQCQVDVVTFPPIIHIEEEAKCGRNACCITVQVLSSERTKPCQSLHTLNTHFNFLRTIPVYIGCPIVPVIINRPLSTLKRALIQKVMYMVPLIIFPDIINFCTEFDLLKNTVYQHMSPFSSINKNGHKTKKQNASFILAKRNNQLKPILPLQIYLLQVEWPFLVIFKSFIWDYYLNCLKSFLKVENMS